MRIKKRTAIDRCAHPPRLAARQHLVLARHLTLLVIAVVFLQTGCGEAPAAGPPGPTAVTVTKPVVRTETRYFEYVGNTAAVEQVDIVARVPGVLVKQNYTLLDEDNKVRRVKVGDVLFEIEHEPYQIAVDTADAEVKRAEALEAAARATFEGVQQRFERGAAANIDVTLADAELKQRAAERLAAEAQLARAKLELSYTYVRSPIEGEVSRNLVDEGTYVGGNGPTLLTKVRQTAPIYVYFDVNESIVQQYLARAAQDAPNDPLAPPPLELATSSDPAGTYPHTGIVDWWDRSVDQGTGSIVVRGRLDNENGVLVPGLFARIRVPFENMPDTVLIREEAIGTDLSGKYVMVVVQNEQGQSVVRKQPVTLGVKTDDGLRQVTGLAGDATYVIEGLQKVRPGMPVRAELRPDPLANAADPPVDAGALPSGEAPARNAPAPPPVNTEEGA